MTERVEGWEPARTVADTACPRRRRLPLQNIAAATLAALFASGCQDDEAAAQKPLLRVHAVDATPQNYAPVMSLTGVIAARTETNVSFRTGGRVAERNVEVGDHVEQGAMLARIDPQEQQSDLKAAKAAVDAAQANVRQTAAAFDRQKTLLAQGFTTRRDYDQAEQAMQVAQGTFSRRKASCRMPPIRSVTPSCARQRPALSRRAALRQDKSCRLPRPCTPSPKMATGTLCST